MDEIYDVSTRITSTQDVTGAAKQQLIPQEHQEEQVLASNQEQQPPRRYPVRVKKPRSA